MHVWILRQFFLLYEVRSHFLSFKRFNRGSMLQWHMSIRTKLGEVNWYKVENKERYFRSWGCSKWNFCHKMFYGNSTGLVKSQWPDKLSTCLKRTGLTRVWFIFPALAGISEIESTQLQNYRVPRFFIKLGGRGSIYNITPVMFDYHLALLGA